MAPDNSNWLSFSLSPMEMLASTTSQSQQFFFNDNNFYANGWSNGGKPSAMYAGDTSSGGDNGNGNDEVKETDDSPMFLSFMDSHINQQQAPKLEDFLGGDTTTTATATTTATVTATVNPFRYTDQAETQDSSSLTHMYDGTSPVYFSDQQDLNGIAGTAGFQTFSANSGSEVDDSGTQLTDFAGQSIESGNELAYVQCPMNALSLGITTTTSGGGGGGGSAQDQKAIVAVDVDSGDQNNSCKKIADTFGQRTSIYRGVTRHRWTGRYEAHLWDNSCRREGQARKGRQVYLGGYDKEDKAARAYDLAALKYWGPTATTNFPVASYAHELEEMQHTTKQEFIASLRRKSSGFSRGASIYRGVTRHHQQGRWQARIGRVAGNKDLYLGTFTTEEEAAEAYDIAAIKFRGINAVTNFEMSRYDVEAISSSSLPVGGSAKRLKVSSPDAEQKPLIGDNQMLQQYGSGSGGTNISFASVPPVYALPYDQNAAQMYHHQSLFHHLQSGHGGASQGPGSTAIMAPPAEFFIWPNQSY